jgi:hypothetical protein
MGILREPARIDRQSQVLFCIMLAVAAYLGARALWPAAVPSLYDCPFHYFLGLNCLGCGVTRACVSLLSGHVVDALRYNPLVLLVFPFIAYRFASLVSAAVLKRELVSGWPRAFVNGYQWAFVVLAVVVGMARVAFWLYPASGDALSRLLLIPPGH